MHTQAHKPYDRVYWWNGGTERGRWIEAWVDTAMYDDCKDIDELHASIKRMGYIAFKGVASIGAPEGNPHKR